MAEDSVHEFVSNQPIISTADKWSDNTFDRAHSHKPPAIENILQ